MNLGSTFRINLKNLMIFIDMLLDLRREQRKRDLYFGWLEGEAKGGKENATMLNGFFRGGVEGVEGEAYDCLVVGVGFGESGCKGFGLQVKGGLSWVCSKGKQVS